MKRRVGKHEKPNSRSAASVPLFVGFLVAVAATIGVVLVAVQDEPTPTELARAETPIEVVTGGEPSAPILPPAEKTITLAFSGDTLPHTAVVDRARVLGRRVSQPFDFVPMFQEVRGYIEGADLALCHLEVPLSPDNSQLSSYPVFNAPREVAVALNDVGYDGCSTASNHSLDKGFTGVTDTLNVLDEEGVAHVGTARSAFEGSAPRLYRSGDFVVGHVSATYGLNGFKKPSDKPWSVDLWEADLIIQRAEATRRAGADIVVVSLHWGVEYNHSPTAAQRSLAEILTASPAIDAIIGHHAHVLQPIERVGGKVVAFGLGNFLSNQSQSCCPAASQDGAIVLVTFQGNPSDGSAIEAVDVRYVPTWVDRSTFTIRSVPDALANGEAGIIATSWNRTVKVLSQSPEVAQPLTIPVGYEAPQPTTTTTTTTATPTTTPTP